MVQGQIKSLEKFLDVRLFTSFYICQYTHIIGFTHRLTLHMEFLHVYTYLKAVLQTVPKKIEKKID
jgi:hypothetical protein